MCIRDSLYTGDKKFLKETAYPVMKECALFLLSHMVYNNGGRITIGKCTDIERLGPAVENAFLMYRSARFEEINRTFEEFGSFRRI